MDEIIRPEREQSHAREPANPFGSRPRFDTVDPSNERPGRSYEGHTAEEALAIARDARAAFERWRRTSFADRARLVKAAVGVLRKRRDEFAELMTAEMGKTVTAGRAEIEKCAFNCDYFAERAEGFLRREPVNLGGPEAFVAFNPLGVVLAVMPWDFPFWQVFRFAALALMAGNGAVLTRATRKRSSGRCRASRRATISMRRSRKASPREPGSSPGVKSRIGPGPGIRIERLGEGEK